MRKATAIAPANIALIKYWGKKNAKLRLPLNSSIAINQSNLYTITTVEFSPEYTQDTVFLDGKKAVGLSRTRMVEHLDKIRTRANIQSKAKIVSQNSFPATTGFASSASGFAALTLAAATAAGLALTERELSILARLGSGSAARSIPDGFVEWIAGETSRSSYAYSLYPPDYWPISILAVVIDAGKKKVSSTAGHQLVTSNPFLAVRLARIEEKIKQLKEYLQAKDFRKLGELVEAEALELHSMMFTSHPPLIYWQPETLRVIHALRRWREEGLNSYFTIDAGANLHVFCQDKHVNELTTKLKHNRAVKDVIVSKPGKGAQIAHKHIF